MTVRNGPERRLVSVRGRSQPGTDVLGCARHYQIFRDCRLLHGRTFIDCRDQLVPIVGVYRDRFPRSRQADVERLLIDQIGRLAVRMDHDVIGSAALGGESSLDIGVANVLVAGVVETQRLGLSARISDGGYAGLFVDHRDCAARPVDPTKLAVVAGELDAVACLQFKRLR